ncbi:MAG: DUF4402 domain-containing protein [Bacteroidales bacterium]|nr:DUF4402 domain-containing protein [Bacteroidales bacterium]
MKNRISTLLVLAVVTIALSTDAFGQTGASATATAAATIVSPIAISKDVDMSFGNVAVNTNPGTVVLATDGSRTSTGGVTLPATTGTVTAASFTVTGTTGYTFAISLPASVTVSLGANNMTVDNFSSSLGATGTLTAGTATLNVGATLNVLGSQAPGNYVSGTPFTVTVNYN